MKIKIGFFAVCTLLAWLWTNPLYGVAILFAATLHELGHIFVAKWLGFSFQELNITPFGALLSPGACLGSYYDEALIAAAGPFINIVSVVFVAPFCQKHSFLSYFCVSSLFLGGLNLLPVSDFDGGRILSCILYQRLNASSVERVLQLFSFLIVFFLWAISVYLLLRVGASLSLFVFSASLFFKLFADAEFMPSR